jgi:CRISPR-associated protein Cas6/Cse3/CasE subtype I-E
MVAPPTLRIDLPRVSGGVSPRPARSQDGSGRVMSFTKLELPTFDTYETAVTFDADCDPLSAHDAMVPLFGQKAGQGKFLFCADSAVPGRFWVRSTVPWEHMPVIATTALEPKRVALQLATGLMYHFTVPLCVGEETVIDGRKHVRPYTTDEQYIKWFEESAPAFGIKPLMACAELRSMRFRQGESSYRIDHAVLEGALELVDPDILLQRLLRGFGAHRRAGLGLMKLTA